MTVGWSEIGWVASMDLMAGRYRAAATAALAGVLCYVGIMVKGRFGYDDSLDVVGIHGVGGVVGILATGLFASKAINPGGADGLFFGNPAQFGIQAVTVLAVVLFSLLGTYLILKLVDRLLGLRVPVEEEALGLDLSQHNERAYS